MNLKKKQVDKSHYTFTNYISKARWCSLWHQLDEVVNLAPNRVLEIGPGAGIFKHTAALFGLKVETIDIDPELKPDYEGSATDLPFPENSYDVVCAFQMLEHLPYDISLQAFREMVRVSERYILISLPDVSKTWHNIFHLPKLGKIDFFITLPQFRLPVHKFDGEHHWEISKLGYSLEKIVDDFTRTGAKLIKTYRVSENTYHRFFIFQK